MLVTASRETRRIPALRHAGEACEADASEGRSQECNPDWRIRQWKISLTGFRALKIDKRLVVV